MLQNVGDLGVFEEVANEGKTLEIVRTPAHQTPKEGRVERGFGD